MVNEPRKLPSPALRKGRTALALLASAAAFAAGCGNSKLEDPVMNGNIGFAPDRPTLGSQDAPPRYTGSNPTVLEAQDRLSTGLDLHSGVILRTCGPTGGVCHNTKEYPDLHTPANFLAAFNSPCNVQSGTPDGIFDRCERPGDKIQLGDLTPIEIGWFEYKTGDYDPDTGTAPDADTPGLHFHLAEPVGHEFENRWYTADFIRPFLDSNNQYQNLSFFQLQTNFWTLGDGSELYGRIPEYLGDDVQRLMTVGIVQGDANHNGIFGARDQKPLSLLTPGDPEESYLIGRLRGDVGGQPVPGTRMPLANQPLDTAEMLALFCFIQGAKPGVQPDLTAPIDYADCPYSQNPDALNLLGNGVTWASRIKSLLAFNCGGCHGGNAPAQNLNLVDGDVYKRLLQASTEKPDMMLIDPKSVATSYLYLKLTGGVVLPPLADDGGAPATSGGGTTTSSGATGAATGGMATGGVASTGGATSGGDDGGTTGGTDSTAGMDPDAGVDDEAGTVLPAAADMTTGGMTGSSSGTAIVGFQMPLDSTGQPRPLSAADLDAIRAWIAQGATENQ